MSKLHYHSVTEGLALVAAKIKRNPVLLGAAVLWAADILSTGDPITWRSAITIGVGVLVRARVMPATEVYEYADEVDAFVTKVLRAAEDGTK